MKKLFCYSWIVLFAFLLLLPGAVFAQEVKKILSIEAFDMLNTVPDTYLIDVRSRAEYQFVGHPYKAHLFPYMFFTTNFVPGEEQSGYQMSPKNKVFVEEISKVYKKTDNLLILGRDGTRSGLAAKDLIEAGFKNVFDVSEGFEGPTFPTFEDANRNKFYRQLAKRNKIFGFEHRRHYGWQWWGLPWTYDIDPKYVYPPDLRPPEK
ncbi:MAG: rhodanese-like domain-containing protein [Deltaproteobacteria bacterium]|jgi:rhodanese-related sulfurtransferase